MAETAALVPVPFYPLVRVDSGASDRFNPLPQRSPADDAGMLTAAPERIEHRRAYSRDGCQIDDRLVGVHVDVYV